MGQCGRLKLIPAQGRWWLGRALRSQHNLGRSSLGFWSCWSRREPRSQPSADPRHFHPYGGYAHFQREPGIAMRSQTYSRTPHSVGSATIYFFLHSYRRFSLWACITSPTRARLGGRRSRVGARAEATSPKNQVVAYGCYAMGLKPSPPTIYHGQGLAWVGHPGSYRSAMSKSEESVTT